MMRVAGIKRHLHALPLTQHVHNFSPPGLLNVRQGKESLGAGDMVRPTSHSRKGRA